MFTVCVLCKSSIIKSLLIDIFQKNNNDQRSTTTTIRSFTVRLFSLFPGEEIPILNDLDHRSSTSKRKDSSLFENQMICSMFFLYFCLLTQSVSQMKARDRERENCSWLFF